MSDLTPLHLGGDAWLVRSLPDGDTLRLPLESLVLRGAEPVLIDTGAAAGRTGWWSQVEHLVDPADVRWIFISHDDADHIGNLHESLERCPSATLVTSRSTAERMQALTPLPPERCRWVDDGDWLDLPDRRLHVLRPPAYDSPATRGLFDPTSGVYWAADCFGSAVPHPVTEVADLDSDVWTDAFLLYHHLLSPWAADIEPLRWRAAVARVAALGCRVIASAHGPAVRGPLVGRALDLLSEVPTLAPAPSQKRREAPQPAHPPVPV